MFKHAIVKGGHIGTQDFNSTLQSVQAVLASTVPLEGERGVIDIKKYRAEVRAEAYQQGYDEGFQAGHQDGEQKGFQSAYAVADAEARSKIRHEMAEFKARISNILEQSNQAMAQWYVNAEETATDLIIDICKQVLRTELSMDRAAAVSLVKQCLSELSGQQRAVIKVNPYDAIVMRTYRDEILNSVVGMREIQFVEDPSIIGGCVIETEGMSLDASFDTQLENYRQQVDKAA